MAESGQGDINKLLQSLKGGNVSLDINGKVKEILNAEDGGSKIDELKKKPLTREEMKKISLGTAKKDGRNAVS